MEMMMMWRRDLMSSINLNSPATPPAEEDYDGGGAAMEAMRQAMLHHDAVFKHQVSELHRLYWTQKSLMSELMCRYNPSPEPVGLMRSIELRLPVDVDGMRDSGEEGLLLPRRAVRCFAGEPGIDSDHHPASTMERWSLSNQGSDASLWHDDRSSSPSPPVAGLNDVAVAPPFNVFPIKMQSDLRVPIDLNEAIDVEILPDLVAEHNICDESGSGNDHQLVLFPGVSIDRSSKGSIVTCHHDASSSIPRCTTGSRGSLSSSIRYSGGETARTTVDNNGGYVAGENSCARPVHGDRNQRSLSSEGSDKRVDAPGGHHKVESSDLGTTSISFESHTTFSAALDGDARSKPDLASKEVPDRSSSLSIGERNSIVSADNMNQGSHSSVCCETKAALTGHSGDQQMEEDEMESMIFKASQILLHMSLQGELKASEEEPPPRHSSDTFEAMTLMLPECKDYGFPSPGGGELNDPPPCKDTGNTRLRRGRWLPDFRKDILPGLVSLSRHEIREDLHSLRQAGDTARDKGSCWFVPVGGRRSRRAAAATRS